MTIENQSSIEGFYDFQGLYQKLVDECPDGGSLLEVGVYKGASIISLCEMIKKSGKSIRVYAVDHWPSDKVYNTFFANTISYQVSHMIKPIRCPSELAHIHFPANSLFAAFIDACHKENSVRNDVLNYLPKVTGYLAGHDAHISSVRNGLTSVLGTDYKVMGNSWIKKI